MELFVVMFLSFGAIGIATTKDSKDCNNKLQTKKETRIFKQTRQTVYDTEMIQDWE